MQCGGNLEIALNCWLLLFRDCEQEERQIMPLLEINGVGNTKKKIVNETLQEEIRKTVKIKMCDGGFSIFEHFYVKCQ